MARQPIILFLMPDQLRADFLSCYGANFIDNPYIDRIANEGVRDARLLAGDRASQDVYRQLDAALTQELMRSLALAHDEKRVYRSDLSQDELYGREGWSRPYPQPLGTAP